MSKNLDLDSDAWARRCIDLSDMLLVGIDLCGRVIRINRKAARTLGYPPEDIIGKDWFDTFLPARIRDELRHVFRSLKEGRVDAQERYENPVLCRDGTERLIVWRNAVLHDDAGRIVAALASGEDMTMQRRSEALLRESETRFRATFEQAAVGFAHVGLDGRFLRFNDKLCAITGYGRAELEALTFQDITHLDDLDADLAQARALHAGEIPFYTMEKRYIRKDGSIAWINLTGSLVRTSAGEPDYFVAVVEDIGLRKQAETLRADEELQRMALAAAHAGAWKWDAENDVQVWTPESYRLFGIDPAERPPSFQDWLSRCVHLDDRMRIEEALDEAVAVGGGEFRVEFRSDHPRDERRWLVSTGRVICDDQGHPLRVYGLNLDVTAQKAAQERQERLTRELDHRVKNMIALTQAIARQTLDGGPRTDAFLNRLGALAKAQSLLTGAAWESIDLSTLIAGEMAAYPSGRVSYSGPPLSLAAATAQTLALVLHELATNASKYGALSNERGRVAIRWSAADGPGRLLRLIWIETDGPLTAPPAREGFGTRLIREGISAEGGGAELHFLREGLVAELHLPVGA